MSDHVRMDCPRRTHILLGFFGTLVEYPASRTEQGYPRSYELLRRMGAIVDYPDFLMAWAQTSAEFDRCSDRDDREFSIREVGAAFLPGCCDGHRPPTKTSQVTESFTDGQLTSEMTRTEPGWPRLENFAVKELLRIVSTRNGNTGSMPNAI